MPIPLDSNPPTSSSSFVLNPWPPGLPVVRDDRLLLAHGHEQGLRGCLWSHRDLAEAVINAAFELSLAHEGEPAPSDLAAMRASPGAIRWPSEAPVTSREATGALILFVDFLERYREVVAVGEEESAADEACADDSSDVDAYGVGVDIVLRPRDAEVVPSSFQAFRAGRGQALRDGLPHVREALDLLSERRKWVREISDKLEDAWDFFAEA